MNKILIGSVAGLLIAAVSTLQAGQFYIDLGGPATGGVFVSNAKNSSTQNGIEGKDEFGDPNPNHNGLPQYANYQVPNGPTSGVYTAIIASPQSTTTDYASLFSTNFHGGTPITVNNQTISQSDFSTFSAGRINISRSVSDTGTDVVGISDLAFDLNTHAWDGNVTPSVTGDSRSNFNASYADPGSPIQISPFSPVYTEYNDGSGAGNAAFYYEISVSNLTGTGLTFLDGTLQSMDIAGDVTVSMFSAIVPVFGSLDFVGSFSSSGLDYDFDVVGTGSLGLFSNTNLIMNREGTANAQVVPEPSTYMMLALGLGVLVWVRHRKICGKTH